jgi:hypothetical protein
MVEADDLTPEALFAGIRAGRISFHRKSLGVGRLIAHTHKAVAAQPRDLVRLLKKRMFPA